MKKLPIIVLALVVLALNAAAYTAGYTQAVQDHPSTIVVEEWNGYTKVSEQPFQIDRMNTIGLSTKTWYVNTTGITRYDLRFV